MSLTAALDGVEVTALGKEFPLALAPVFPLALVTAGIIDAAELALDMVMVVGRAAVEVEPEDALAPEPELDPPEVMLNCSDCARMAWFPFNEVTRLTWKAVPTGQLPSGKVTETVFTLLAEPVDWLATSVTGELERKPAWG